MIERALRMEADVAALLLVLAVVIFPYGAQHLLGWFGGLGFGGTMEYFASLARLFGDNG